MGDIGPGPLLCISDCHCNGCGEGVCNGVLYQCDELIQHDFIVWVVHGPCGCGSLDHPFVHLVGKEHTFCPSLFVPLGDPDAVIRETDEPQSTKRREDDGYDLPVQTPVKETENV